MEEEINPELLIYPINPFEGISGTIDIALINDDDIKNKKSFIWHDEINSILVCAESLEKAREMIKETKFKKSYINRILNREPDRIL